VDVHTTQRNLATATSTTDRLQAPHPEAKDLEDIQGLVYSAWADHLYAAYIFATLGEAKHSRAWLETVRHQVTAAAPGQRPSSGRVQVALSPRGMAALGVPSTIISDLPHEARAGMRARGRILGDEAPLEWNLGSNDELDVLVMVFGKDEVARDIMVDAQRGALLAAGARLMPTETCWPMVDREHFGFVDGISQPFIRGLHDTPRPGADLIAAGEIVLGYPNAYGRLPHSPRWNGFDLGRNGSYLVFRKLEQYVEHFWGFATESARQIGIDDPLQEVALAEKLAAKMMGRWRSGASLLLAPDYDDPAAAHPDRINNFRYLDEDSDGRRCPISSHVRRSNPRDAGGGSAHGSMQMVGRHRILRRGRPYGPPMPEEQSRAGRSDHQERGLYFICLQTSIARGFEFIQQTWLNNRGFGGLRNESDPITGDGTCPFTIPEDPVRLRLRNVPRFVKVRGGGYFFLPSLTALQRIAKGP
jgi:Dyp-type peroxidase family